MTSKQKVIVKEIKNLIKDEFSGEGSGHDWWHILRVYNMSKHLAKEEKVNDFVVELAALLHDIADWKFHGGDDKIGSKKARTILQKHSVDETVITQVEHIIDNISFKGANVNNTMKSKEGLVVQDADRLDAIGAVGIGRVFAYNGNKGYPMHNPEIKFLSARSFEEYKDASRKTSINHFYEKLLLLKDKMNTKTAKKIALGRHKFMETFLARFYKEWDGKL